MKTAKIQKPLEGTILNPNYKIVERVSLSMVENNGVCPYSKTLCQCDEYMNNLNCKSKLYVRGSK